MKNPALNLRTHAETYALALVGALALNTHSATPPRLQKSAIIIPPFCSENAAAPRNKCIISLRYWAAAALQRIVFYIGML